MWRCFYIRKGANYILERCTRALVTWEEHTTSLPISHWSILHMLFYNLQFTSVLQFGNCESICVLRLRAQVNVFGVLCETGVLEVYCVHYWDCVCTMHLHPFFVSLYIVQRMYMSVSFKCSIPVSVMCPINSSYIYKSCNEY